MVTASKNKIKQRRLALTQFGLHEAISDPQVVSGDRLSVHHPEQSELGRQRVHDHGQVALSNLRRKKKKRRRGETPVYTHIFQTSELTSR